MTARFEIKGRVQGVGYRAYVKRIADEHEINGEVHNCPNGDVAGVAGHDNTATLKQFLARLGQGPGSPKEATWLEIEQTKPQDSGFAITFNRP